MADSKSCVSAIGIAIAVLVLLLPTARGQQYTAINRELSSSRQPVAPVYR